MLGVDVQRIRRALDLRTDGPREDGSEPLTRDQIRRFEQQLRRELERGQIERTKQLPPARSRTPWRSASPSAARKKKRSNTRSTTRRSSGDLAIVAARASRAPARRAGA